MAVVIFCGHVLWSGNCDCEIRGRQHFVASLFHRNAHNGMKKIPRMSLNNFTFTNTKTQISIRFIHKKVHESFSKVTSYYFTTKLSKSTQPQPLTEPDRTQNKLKILNNHRTRTFPSRKTPNMHEHPVCKLGNRPEDEPGVATSDLQIAKASSKSPGVIKRDRGPNKTFHFEYTTVFVHKK